MGPPPPTPALSLQSNALLDLQLDASYAVTLPILAPTLPPLAPSPPRPTTVTLTPPLLGTLLAATELELAAW